MNKLWFLVRWNLIKRLTDSTRDSLKSIFSSNLGLFDLFNFFLFELNLVIGLFTSVLGDFRSTGILGFDLLLAGLTGGISANWWSFNWYFSITDVSLLASHWFLRLLRWLGWYDFFSLILLNDSIICIIFIVLIVVGVGRRGLLGHFLSILGRWFEWCRSLFCCLLRRRFGWRFLLLKLAGIISWDSFDDLFCFDLLSLHDSLRRGVAFGRWSPWSWFKSLSNGTHLLLLYLLFALISGWVLPIVLIKLVDWGKFGWLDLSIAHVGLFFDDDRDLRRWLLGGDMRGVR